MEKSRVLIVDDEPLILAGIKFMLDWEKNGCEVVGTATNGGQALEKIAELMPDIIIADINMPVMNGIELLREVSENFPQIAVIMLTNLEEFELAQDALRFKATDYLTKSKLEPEVLEKSLANAVKESQHRKKLASASLIDHYMHSHHSKILRQAVLEFVVEQELAPEYSQTLKDDGVLNSYGVLHLWFDLPKTGGDDDNSEENQPHLSDSAELIKWQLELVEKLCRNIFQRHFILQNDDLQSIYILYNTFNSGEPISLILKDFHDRLAASSGSITGLFPCIQATGMLGGISSRDECKRQLSVMREYSYFTGEQLVIYQDMPDFQPEPLVCEDLAARLQAACNLHSHDGCTTVYEKAVNLLNTVPHNRRNAQKLCATFYDTTAISLQNQEHTITKNHLSLLYDIQNLWRRADVQLWLDSFFDSLHEAFDDMSKQKNDTIERAKEYALDHIGEKISLQEAAHHVGMSPNYFSTFFKKKAGMNFIDYANRLKIEKACTMIAQGNYRMNEIATLLGFENAYYFSKVFRRYNGVSPSEYQQSHGRADKNI